MVWDFLSMVWVLGFRARGFWLLFCGPIGFGVCSILQVVVVYVCIRCRCFVLVCFQDVVGFVMVVSG